MFIEQGSTAAAEEPSVDEILARRARLRAQPPAVSLVEAPVIRVEVLRGGERTVIGGTFPDVLIRTLGSLVPFHDFATGAHDVCKCLWGLLRECLAGEPPRSGRWGVHAEGVTCRINWAAACGAQEGC